MSLGKLQNALASINNDFTVAAANFRFDFTLIKYEAPKEYQPLGKYLPSQLKEDAEHGKMHTIAQRLGALFEEVCPATPHLVKAYGTRVSSIAESVQDPTNELSKDSIFSAFSGTDGASIWAAATSSTAALQVQLLACMVARVWPSEEAQSLWIEITKDRRKEIISRFEADESVPFASLAAARQLQISKDDIAQWDASARAWLRIADSVKSKEQKKLMLVLDEGSLSVGKGLGTYKDVIDAWATAMTGMERLLTGAPQATHQGAIVIGLSAWHLYPNLIILKSDRPEMKMNDPIFTEPGAVLTIGLQQTQATSPTGVFWSLSLAHLRRYGPPVLSRREYSRNSTRLSFEQLTQATLGAILQVWGCSTREELRTGANIILRLRSFWRDLASSDHVNDLSFILAIGDFNSWMNLLGDAASQLVARGDKEDENVFHAIKLGQRRSQVYIEPSERDYLPFWGLQSHELILNILSEPEDRVRYLRQVAARAVPNEQLIIRHWHGGWHLVNVSPRHIAPNKRKAGPTVDDPFDMSVYSSPPDRTMDLHTEKYHFEKWHTGRYTNILDTNPWQLSNVKDIRLEHSQFEVIYLDGSKRGHTFLFGDFNGASVWIPNDGTISSYEAQPLVSQPPLSALESVLQSDSLLSSHIITEIFGQQVHISSISRTLNCLEKAARVYANLSAATVSVETLNHPLWVASWADSLIPTQTKSTAENDALRKEGTMNVDQDFIRPEDISLPIVNLPKITLDELVPEPDGLTSDEDFQMRPNGAEGTSQTQPPKKTRQGESDDPWKSYLHEYATDFGQTRRMGHEGIGAQPAYLRKDHSSKPSNPASESKKPQPSHEDTEAFTLSRETSLSCIAYFEGSYNIPPAWLRDVFAISSGDSLYIDAQLLHDPSESVESHHIKRVLGNVGRPGITMLIPPSDPMIRELDPDSWTVINHNPFDGTGADFFNRTSLHLSFTEHELVRSGIPLTATKDSSLHSVGKQVTFLESIVSVHSSGVWQADVDILKALKSPYVKRLKRDTRLEEHKSCQMTGRGLVSAQTWEEIFDPPNRSFVVNAYGNWNARLAATAVLAQLLESSQRWKQLYNYVVVCQPSMCWRCATCLDQNCITCQHPERYPLGTVGHPTALVWVQ